MFSFCHIALTYSICNGPFQKDKFRDLMDPLITITAGFRNSPLL